MSLSAHTITIIQAVCRSDPTITGPELAAIERFLLEGQIRFTDLDTIPLMLNASKAAEMIGISPDTFKRVRDQAQKTGVKELCGSEVTPGSPMFNRASLVRFSQGDFDLQWGANRRPEPKAVKEHWISRSDLQPAF